MFKFIEIKDLNEQELLGIIEENAKEAAFTREEIIKLKQAAKPKIQTPSIIIDNSKHMSISSSVITSIISQKQPFVNIKWQFFSDFWL